MVYDVLSIYRELAFSFLFFSIQVPIIQYLMIQNLYLLEFIIIVCHNLFHFSLRLYIYNKMILISSFNFRADYYKPDDSKNLSIVFNASFIFINKYFLSLSHLLVYLIYNL